MRMRFAVLLLVPATVFSEDRNVEPTWLHRDLSAAPARAMAVTRASCHSAPPFGEGASESRSPLSVPRFGDLTIAPGGECQPVSYPRQEEIYFVRDGSGLLHFADQAHA